MTASRAEAPPESRVGNRGAKRCAPVLVLGLLLAGLSGTQAAERAPPVRLLPPATDAPAEPRREPPVPARAAPARPPAGPEMAGLPELVGAFGLPLWRGSSRAAVARLLDGLPERVASPALDGLLFRVLAAGAAPPEGPGARLAPLRVLRLQALGRAREAAALAAAAGIGHSPPPGESGPIDRALAAGDVDAACAGAEAEMQRAPDAELQRVAAFCAARAGDVERAGLILDILREVGGDGDPLFESLMLRATGTASDAPLPEDGPASLLNVALLAHLGQPAPPAWAERDDPQTARALAALAPDIEAAEAAARAGALAPKLLLERYLRETNPNRDRAVLARAAVAATEPQDVLAALSPLWESALAAGLLPPVASATVGLAAPFAPAPELARHTFITVLAALAAGRFDIAERWYVAAVRRGESDDADRDRAVLTWPLLRLADSQGAVAWSEDGLARWLKASGGARPHAPAAMLFGLMEALGDPVGPDDWTALLDDLEGAEGPMPAPAVWRGLQAASRAGRLGEAVLYAVIAAEGRARADMPTATAIVGALARVGLSAEARAYAFECLIEASR